MPSPRSGFLVYFVALGAAIALLSGCTSTGGARDGADPSTEGEGGRQVEVFYVTDRESSASAGEYYGTERGPVSYGVSSVGMPPHHELGANEAPSVFKFQWSPDEQKHITIKGITALGQQAFFQLLEQKIDLSPGRKLLVFVHGYNVEYAEAVRLLAQFANDLKFQGPALLFSWPSQGSLTSYTVDETNAEWAQPHLVDLLDDILDDTTARQIYIVAHSMGSRIATRGFIALAGDRPLADIDPIKEMILVAPDIDADLFRADIAPRLASNGIHVTLYASSGDRALMASKAFHGYARAGDSGEGMVIVDGVETVDASVVSGGLIGHSYFAEDRRIMEDIYGILQTGQRADNRFGLEAVNSDSGRYWTFRK
jgi:esterase/lipase superfamily enzyme